MSARDASPLNVGDDVFIDGKAFSRSIRRAVACPVAALGTALGLLLILSLLLLQPTRRVEQSGRIIGKLLRLQDSAYEASPSFDSALPQQSGIQEGWVTARQRVASLSEELNSLVAHDEAKTEAAGQLRLNFQRWQAEIDEALARGVPLNRAGGTPETTGRNLFEAFRSGVARMIYAERVERDAQLENIVHLQNLLLGAVLLAALLGLPLLVLAISKLLSRVHLDYEIGVATAQMQRDELEITLRSIGDAVAATDARGMVRFLNPVAERLTGWSDAEAQGRSLAEVMLIFDENTGVAVENPVERVLRDKVVVELANHTMLRSRSGREILIEDSAAPIFDTNGVIRGVILVFHDVTEKKIRERQLRDAEWLARTALELGGAGAWVWEVERDLVFGDALLARSFNVPLDRCRAGEPIATFFSAIHEEDRERVRGVVAHALSTSGFYECEYRVIGEGGVQRWVSGRGRVDRDGSGKPMRLPGVLFDITAQKDVEAELRASEARARAIVNTSLDPVVLMSSSGKVADWNAAAERVFGWKREEILGKELADHIIPERLRAAHHRGLSHLRATGEGPVLGRRLELYAVRRDGVEFPVELAINPLRGADTATYVGFIRDISQRKATEEQLAERARLSGLRADVSGWLATSDSVDTILHQCCELLVQHLDAAFARVWLTLADEPTLVLRASAGIYTHLDGAHARIPVGQFKIGRIAENRRAHLTNDVANDPNISDPEWANREGMKSFAGYPLISEGRVLGVLALFSRQTLSNTVLGDLAPMADAIAATIERRRAETELVAAKERAEVASRAKDDFLATLSHELRTPLMPVLMTATALREDERLPEEIRAELGMIERNIALEARLIDDLLDLTRINHGKLQLREAACDAHSLISLAVEIVRDEAQTKPVNLQLDLGARRTGIQGDPARLQQVFWNLLRNAIKFTPPGGQITIRTRDETDERLRVEVEDTGVGLQPEMLETIFQPFEQAGFENDHRFGGLGLGLAIAHAIVDLHRGIIRAESPGPDCGATFIVELPSSGCQITGIKPASTLSNQADGNECESSGRGSDPVLRLLLVEDHEPTRAVLRRLLMLRGHDVFCAESVASALAAAEARQFDVVISDLGLPDGTGLELLVKLHAIQPQLRGIALSGYGMEQDLRRSEAAGFRAHLIKPVDFEQLRRTLRMVQD